MLLQICPCNALIVVSCDFVAIMLRDFTFTVYKVGSVAPVSVLSYAHAAASILFHSGMLSQGMEETANLTGTLWQSYIAHHWAYPRFRVRNL